MISVFLPSYNKRGFAVEAVRSVFGQSYPDWELWLMENSDDNGRTRNLLDKFTDLGDPRVHYEELDMSEAREHHCIAPYLLNQYYDRANGDIIMYISDDDLFMPKLFQAVTGHFDANPDHHALYFSLARFAVNNPGEGTSWSTYMGIPADSVRGSEQLDCEIDGGQVAYRRHVLNSIGKPYFYDGKDRTLANHCDGLHLESVARAGIPFYPLPVPGVIHRHTPSSLWSPPVRKIGS